MERVFFIKLVVFLPVPACAVSHRLLPGVPGTAAAAGRGLPVYAPGSLKLQNGMFLPHFGGCIFSKALVVTKIHLLQLP